MTSETHIGLSKTGSFLFFATILSVTVSLNSYSGSAQAQPGTENSYDYIEEVVTTARRREESLLDVPLSISVISGDDLERMGVSDLIEIGNLSPNVTLEVSRGTNTTLTAFIRGVGQQDPVAGFESGVGLYVDDVYFNRPHAAVLDLYDVEQIEVLRGPQGTLYGRNTIGGAIKYVSRGLPDTSQLKVKGSLGTENQLDALITASAPLSDSLRIGGTVAKFTRDGFGSNLNLTDLENYNKDVLGVRVSVEWDVSDQLSLKFAGDHTQDDSDPKAGHRLLAGNVSGAPVLASVFDTRAGLNTPKQSVEANGFSLVADWTINDNWRLKNIVADRSDDTTSPIDFDSLPMDDLDVPVIYENEQFSEELQLLYTGDRLSGILGFYYLDANAFNEFDVVLGPLGDLIGLPGLNANTFGDVDTKTWSVFADFTYEVTDTVDLSVGVRHTSDERTSTILRRTFLGGLSPVFGGSAAVIATTSDFKGSKKFTEFSPRFAISWHPDQNHNVYFTYNEGFKGGSFDPRAQTSATPDFDGNGTVTDEEIFKFVSFDPETVSSYEIGLKSRWLDNRLQTSLAVFFGDYEDVQIPGSVGVDTDDDGINDTFTGITTNAGKAELPGVEFEGLYYANENWSLGWAVGYLNADYKEFFDATGTNVADQAVFQNTPELTAAMNVTYETSMSLLGLSGSFAVITRVAYRDEASQFEFPNPLLDEGSYSLLDLSVVWEADDGKWRVGLHGKNLTDELYKVAGYNFPALGLEGNVTAFYGNPRTVTGTVEYRL